MPVILVNLVHLERQTNGGGSRLIREISRTLIEISDANPHFHPVFAVGTPSPETFSTWLGRSANILPVTPGAFPRPALRGINADLIVNPLFGIEPIDQLHDLVGKPHIVMVPDTLALDRPDYFPQGYLQDRLQSYDKLSSARKILTLSEFTRQRLVQHLNLPADRIVVLPSGADARAESPLNSLDVAALQPFLFFPANPWPHKRHHLALESFKEILNHRPNLNLVMTGSRFLDFGVNIPALVEELELPAERVHDLGLVDDDQLPQLYAKAEALFFPSAYEGFGQPILEAMYAGCPVVCAPVAAIPEIAGEAALYVDSADPLVWAKAILEDLPGLRDRLIAAGQQQAEPHTWAKTRAFLKGFMAEMIPAAFDGSNKNTPQTSLLSALQENRLTPLTGMQPIRFSTGPVGQSVPHNFNLEAALAELTALLDAENQSSLANTPLLGRLIKTLYRMRNMGRYARITSEIATALALRQQELRQQIQHLKARKSSPVQDGYYD